MSGVFALIVLVISIGIVDSVNPATIIVALYLAAGDHPGRRVTEFTFGVFATYLLGGVAVALGLGQLILAAVPRPGATARAVGEIVVGAALVAMAAVLWANRRRLAERLAPRLEPGTRSTAILGAAMTVVELPTAFPYLAAIGAIVDSGVGITRQLILLVLFNVCFVLPLILIIAALMLSGERALPLLRAARLRLERHWPLALTSLALLAGLLILGLGASSLAGAG